MIFKGSNQYELFPQVMSAFFNCGIKRPSRNGDVLQLPGVVQIVQTRPWERVFVHPVRDSNPFFHLMEALAMLVDYNSVPFLSHFAKNMKEFSDDGLTYNAFYGTRARTTFGLDQLEEVVKTLKADPASRQAVVQMWNPMDLIKQTKDKACNMSMIFSVDHEEKLCLTTFNRSNDAIWGYFGANAVHLSIFQEYVAEQLDRDMGNWTHVSNNFHGYMWNEKFKALLDDPDQWYSAEHHYSAGNVRHSALGSEKKDFLLNLREFIVSCHSAIMYSHLSNQAIGGNHSFINEVAEPIFRTFQLYRYKKTHYDIYHPGTILWNAHNEGVQNDWFHAGREWLNARGTK